MGDTHVYKGVNIDEKGQIKIPEEAMKHFNLKCGDHLTVVGKDGIGIVITPLSKLKLLINSKKL